MTLKKLVNFYPNFPLKYTSLNKFVNFGVSEGEFCRCVPEACRNP